MREVVHNAQNEAFKRRVAALERELFGCRRERFVPDEPTPVATDSQPKVNAATTDATTTAPPSNPTVPTNVATTGANSDQKRSSKGRAKRVYPASIPVEKKIHRLDPSDVDPELWNNPRAVRFVHLLRKELDFQPASYRIIEHYQEVIVLDDDQEETQMQAADSPAPILPRGFMSASLLAHIAVSRFADHLPYYRQEDIFGRIDLVIGRSTQWRAMRQVGLLVTPLVDLMRKRVASSAILGIDETPIKILCEGGTRQSYLYAQYGDAAHPYVCFDFSSHKAASDVERIVGQYSGILQSDAYICYELLLNTHSDTIQGAGCWAHARRKFEPLKQLDGAKWILGGALKGRIKCRHEWALSTSVDVCGGIFLTIATMCKDWMGSQSFS